MMYLCDRGDNWSSLSDDMRSVCFEDGTTEPLTPDHVELEIGKYKGQKLSEISDVWYLNFLKKLSTEKNLDFVTYCINIRLLELNKK